MFTIVGLGNPGERYSNTRHNVGFMALEELNNRYQGSFRKGRGPYFLTKVLLCNNLALLVKPATYMNLSGQAVRHLTDYYKIEDFSKLLIVSDDFNLPLGTIRLRASGSAGGQKGLISIFESLKSNNIPRLRIGIGNGFRNAETYVLSPFNKSEQKILPEVIAWACDAIEAFVVQGKSEAMNQFNRSII